MDGLQAYLIELSDRLDDTGHKKCADAVDELIKTESMQKLAQYVGVIGYALKQNRAMGNCIRQKRTASNNSMQEIILECLKEYQDGQDYLDTDWTQKYAQMIIHEPRKFDLAHLILLSTIGTASKMNDHLERVHKTAEMLQTSGINEPIFNKILSHIATLGTILEKDSSTYCPFKVAATPSKRNWWDRFWNPNAYKWWNPNSWSGSKTERGQDKDVILEMQQLISELSLTTQETQRIRTSISRIKHEVSGYTAGSGEGLGTNRRDISNPPHAVQERDLNIETIKQKVELLDPDDWNKSMLIIQQLRWALRKKNIVTNEYNQQIIQRATDLVQNIVQNMDSVYNHVSNIQEHMHNLRSSPVIMGRELGLDEGSQPNPWAKESPAEEYSVLEKVLERLYTNPFDTQAQWYAQKIHARLWDKLRYIERPVDEQFTQWMSDHPSAEENSQQGNAPETLSKNPNNQRLLLPTVSPDAIKDIRDNITPETINQLSSLAAILSQSENQNVRDIASQFYHLITGVGTSLNEAGVSSSRLEGGTEERATVQQPATEQSPSAYSVDNIKTLQEIPEPVKDEVSAYIQEIADPVIENLSPREVNEVLISLANDNPRFLNKIHELNSLLRNDSVQAGEERQKILNSFQNEIKSQLGRIKEKRTMINPGLTASADKISLMDIVKFADVIDKYNPEIADLLDNFIEQYLTDDIKFVEFSNLIKEE